MLCHGETPCRNRDKIENITMTMLAKKNILADGRWIGKHGIGRFSSEILSRLKNTDIIQHGPKPLSIQNFIWQPLQLYHQKNHYSIFFTPGFNPVFSTKLPYVLTICDLIYLHTPGLKGFIKKIFFELVIKSSIKKASKIFTISEYSKKSIVDWAKISTEKVINISCGVSEAFHPEGPTFNPGYPYLLHVGNIKTHKNIERLIIAFADSKIDSSIKLLFTSQSTSSIAELIKLKALKNRVVFLNTLTENELANCYRGATALVFPSLYEGFGLPILEAMASGIPVLTSNTTSCPEVAGDAAVLVNPMDNASIREGIEKIVTDTNLRKDLIIKGFARTKDFSWDKTAALAEEALNNTLTN